MQDKQMQFMFMNEGGTAQGAPVDPVSGNDIPPGGTAEGVRDDVDAKLSEGEYVIPANVVRFYGIDKFEKMIIKAEETLAEMESKGRMGNSADPAQEEDDLPFDVSELQTAEQAAPVGMAAGGVVGTPSTGGFESRPYINPETGERRIVLLYNGNPINGAVPAGFVPETLENKAALNLGGQTSVRPVSGGTKGDDKTLTEGDDPDRLDVTKWTTEDFENMMAQQPTTALLSRGMGLTGPAGLLIGAAIRKGNELTMNRARDEIMRRLDDPNLSQEDKDKLVEVYKQIEEDAKEGDEGGGLLGSLTGGDGLLGSLMDGEGLLGGLFKSTRSDGGITGKPRVASPSAASTTSRGTLARRPESGSDRTSTTPVSSSRPVSRPTTSSSSTRSSAPNPGGVNRSSPSYKAPDEDRDKSGPFNKGGLVTRRKK